MNSGTFLNTAPGLLLFNRRFLLTIVSQAAIKHLPATASILTAMADFLFTDYFENEVLRKRSYLKKEWCTRVVENPVRAEPQEANRYRFWAPVPELEGRYLKIGRASCRERV